MGKTIFVSVELPQEVKEHLAHVQKQISQIPGLEARFSPKDKFHITLKFLGNATGADVEIASDRLHTIDFNQFDLKLGDVGVFNQKEGKWVKPNVIFVKVSGKGLKKLNRVVHDTLRNAAVFELNPRFTPHISLAKPTKVSNVRDLISGLKRIKVERKSFRVKDFHLSESKKGAPQKSRVYERLQTFRLKPKRKLSWRRR